MIVYICDCGTFGFHKGFSAEMRCRGCGRHILTNSWTVMNRESREMAQHLLQVEKALEEISGTVGWPSQDFKYSGCPELS